VGRAEGALVLGNALLILNLEQISWAEDQMDCVDCEKDVASSAIRGEGMGSRVEEGSQRKGRS
jgi:hypothetical protein